MRLKSQLHVQDQTQNLCLGHIFKTTGGNFIKQNKVRKYVICKNSDKYVMLKAQVQV